MNRGTSSRARVARHSGRAAGDCGVTAQTTAASTQASTVKVGIIYSRTGLLGDLRRHVRGGSAPRHEVPDPRHEHGQRPQDRHSRSTTTPASPANAVTTAKDLIGQGYKIIAGATSSGVGAGARAASPRRTRCSSSPGRRRTTASPARTSTRSAPAARRYQDILAAKAILGEGRRQEGRRLRPGLGVRPGQLRGGQGRARRRGHTVSKVLVPLTATDFTPFAQQAKSRTRTCCSSPGPARPRPAMWQALDQQGVLGSTTVSTGLAERATWTRSASPDGITFLSHYVSNAPDNKVNDWLVDRCASATRCRTSSRRTGSSPRR